MALEFMGLDAHICEYILKPSFWILGVFLAIVFKICVLKRLPAPKVPGIRGSTAKDVSDIESGEATFTSKHDDDSDTTPSPPVEAPSASSPRTAGSRPRGKQLTLWLAPFLRSRARRAVAVVVYLFFVGAALVESYWLFVTLARATAKMFRYWPVLASVSPPWWAYVGYAMGSGGMLYVDVMAFAFAAIFVASLLVCILELLVARYPVGDAAHIDLDVVKVED